MYTVQYSVTKAKHIHRLWMGKLQTRQTRNYHSVVHFTHGVFSRVQLMENRADVN